MCKPDNDIVLMKVARKMLGLNKEQFSAYNLDDEFLSKPIDILVGVKHCAVVTTPIDYITRKGYLHPHLNVMETRVGKGYSLQGTLGGNYRDFSHPIASKRRVLQISEEEYTSVKQDGISVNSKKLRPEVLVELLCRHGLENHRSQPMWESFTKTICAKAGVEFPEVVKSDKECSAWFIEGKRINMFGVDLPQVRCTYAEMLINELMPTKPKSFVEE